MSRQLPTPLLDQTNLSTTRRGPAGASLGLALARLVVPQAVAWYLPRRQLIQSELRKLRGRQPKRVPASRPTPGKLRFHSFEPAASQT
ncbi:hypothetical protein [Enhygromyxa salina]|uniref:Uncharacterized protein n=1 Tax=Enhygromyxa salina TaxID=215803 RepID=A0A2S9YTS0_9BACT|nr:hypothetical protein [Enhygromyxa salina]PRQ08486.1 hypothetical protein ENSA7_17720 [Enhygromyxa salina]